MNYPAKGLLMASVGMAFFIFAAATAWSAPPADWSEVPTTTVKLFHPGQSSYQWLRGSGHKRANKKVIQGDSCISCHSSE